tara:strand:- start:350 stop:733 length:384 start_codon:yes stop_codon:yes gene_type:complete
MGGMVRLLATLGAKGASKFFKRRKQLSGGKKAAKSAAAALAAGEFVKRKQQISRAKKTKPIKKAMGGEAAESVGRAIVERSQRKIRRDEVDEMLDRLYGTGIKPKKKPKNPNRIKPKIKPKTKPKKL